MTKKGIKNNTINPFFDSQFNQLFEELYTPLCRYCVKIVGDQAVAEDIVQDQFVYVWENRERLSSISYIKAYLYKSVKNKTTTTFMNSIPILKYITGFLLLLQIQTNFCRSLNNKIVYTSSQEYPLWYNNPIPEFFLNSDSISLQYINNNNQCLDSICQQTFDGYTKNYIYYYFRYNNKSTQFSAKKMTYDEDYSFTGFSEKKLSMSLIQILSILIW